MASLSTLTVFFGFYVVFCCLDLLEEAAAMTRTAQSAGLPRLTPPLLYAHVRALGRADAGAGARLVARLLARATLLVAVVAILSAAAVRLGGAGGVLDLGGADDVGWLKEE